VLRGDPEAWHMIVEGAKVKMREFLPGRSR
jgi:hypothetical protein